MIGAAVAVAAVAFLFRFLQVRAAQVETIPRMTLIWSKARTSFCGAGQRVVAVRGPKSQRQPGP